MARMGISANQYLQPSSRQAVLCALAGTLIGALVLGYGATAQAQHYLFSSPQPQPNYQGVNYSVQQPRSAIAPSPMMPGLVSVGDAPPSDETPIYAAPNYAAPRQLGFPGLLGDRTLLRATLAAEASACAPPPDEDIPPMPWEPLLRLPRDFLRSAGPGEEPRHIGLGDPLYGTSWLNRPWYVGWSFGGIWGSAPLRGRVGMDEDMIGAYHVGHDYDHYWGWEARFAFARVEIVDQWNPYENNDCKINFWDVSWRYYPWGDARWRPYFTAGIGIASFRFDDELGVRHFDSLLHLPIGMGVKYQLRNWCAIRGELMDNIAIGTSGLSGMHNLSLTVGVEIHFGGRAIGYLP